MKDRDLSTKDFRNPLLTTLGDLSDFQPGVSIKHKEVYDQVFEKMHITDEKAWGQADNGVPWPRRWVQFAFRDLCKQKQGSRAGRGQWMLTPKGVKDALSLSGQDKIKPLKSIDAEAIDAKENIGANIPIENTDSKVDYHPDPYIRSLAAKSVPCFGFYSDKAPTCKGCPIQKDCRDATIKNLKDLTKVLDKKDDQTKQEQKSNTDQKETPDKKQETIDPPSTTDYSWFDDAIVMPVRARARTVCRHCGGFVEKDSSAVWVHHPGASSGKGSAMFHSHCYKEIQKSEVLAS